MSTLDYQKVYQRCRKKLIALAVKSLPCDQDAEDVFESAFYRFFLRDVSKQTEKEAEYYLIRCVLNAVSDYWRRIKKRNETGLDDCFCLASPESNPWERLIHSEDHQWLRQAVSRLPARQREAVWLRYYGEHPMNEIAGIMKCSESTARSLIQNAIQRLKEEHQNAMVERSDER